MKLTLTAEEAKDIVLEDHADWNTIESNMLYHHKQIGSYKDIILHVPSGKHYCFEYDRGTGEWAEPEPYEYVKEVTVSEVEKVEVVTFEWKTVKEVN